MSLTRRSLIEAASAIALGAVATSATAGDQIVVPHSAGTERPVSAAPANACDTHLHIIDRRFRPSLPEAYGGATFQDYRKLQDRLGLTRAVIVQTKAQLRAHQDFEDAHEIAVAGQSPKSGVKATVGAACALREAAQDAAILAQAALIIARRAGPRDRH